jgi:hypothetical protein
MGKILLVNEIEACSLIYQTDLKQLDAVTKFSSSDSSPSPTKEFPSMRKPPAELANRAKRETVGTSRSKERKIFNGMMMQLCVTKDGSS